MTPAESYENERERAHLYRAKLLLRPWYLYVFQPMKTMHLVKMYLDADTMAWLKMRDVLLMMAAEQKRKDTHDGS